MAVTDIFNEKRKSCNHRCPDSVYFHTLLLIIYFCAIETLICRREMRLIGSTSFGFAQNMMHDFQNTILNSWWHCLEQMPQKQNLIPVQIASIFFFCRRQINSTKRQNFRLVQIESICRLQNIYNPNIKMCFEKDRKHCGKRRKCW